MAIEKMVLAASRTTLRTAIAGLVTALVAAGAIVYAPAVLAGWREAAIGAMSRIGPVQRAESVVVVDVDRRSVEALGPWPWKRPDLGRLITAIAAEQPAAIALDMVVSGSCADDADNRALADALHQVPVTLGFVMTERDTALSVRSPIALHRPVEIPGLWRSAGGEQPCPIFVDAAAGLAAVSIAGGRTATVRMVPALVAVGRDLYPGLAVDGVRLLAGGGTLIVGGVDPAVLSLGGLQTRLDQSGNLRLRPSGPRLWEARTIPASDLLSSGSPQLAGKLVFVGSSLPQAGGLRPTDASPLAPSVQIQADIASGLLNGSLPWRPSYAPLLEALATLLASAGVTVTSIRLRPLAATSASVAAAAAWGALVAATYHLTDLAFDPLLPALGTLGAGVAAGVSQYSAAREAEARIRRRFEQRLPPTIVARLAEGGADFRLEGEERVVTALFADIEDFTAMTAAAGARELIRLLDGYFEGVTRIIVNAGGMVDKIVGDAVHAFFNMPLDLDDHATVALACAEEISRFSEAYRNRSDAKRYGFGRTRIGIETGPVVVGDVGAFGKIDYTAYGDAVNVAARLQEANKLTGTSILVGPGLKSSEPAGWNLESRGTLNLRGVGKIEVFSPGRIA